MQTKPVLNCSQSQELQLKTNLTDFTVKYYMKLVIDLTELWIKLKVVPLQ